MNDVPAFLVATLLGAGLGACFFGGLWWTVRKGLASSHPALWFFGSTILRTALVLAGFLFIASGDWKKLLAGLLGFFIARIVVTRLTRISTKGEHAS